MTRVLVTRPEPGATLTLDALLSRGLDAEAIPLTKIAPLAFNAPLSDFDALIVTSQNAARYGADLLAAHISKPVFVVGKSTAVSLQNHNIAASAETAGELVPKIINQSRRSMLYICGQKRKPELETALAAANIQVEAVEVYSATPEENAAKRLEAFFNSTQNGIVLFHAPSAAAAFTVAMKEEKPPETTRFLCMSAAIAAELPLQWQEKISIADRPDEAAMIDQLDKMLARGHMPRA